MERRAISKRLEAIPREQDRLVEGYGKGLVPDDQMRTRMESLKAEREVLRERLAELEHRLQRLVVTEEQESQALAFAEQVRNSLEHLTFAEKQRLLRLLVEDVMCYPGKAVVHTIIPALIQRKSAIAYNPFDGGTGVTPENKRLSPFLRQLSWESLYIMILPPETKHHAKEHDAAA